MTFIKNHKIFEATKNIMERWPMKAMELASQAPYIGTPDFKKKFAMLKMVRAKADNAVEIMDFFINGDW